jgi:hypothetical protein
MNETKWLTGTDGDAMLELVSDRLSPRQWLLASAAFARRLWDVLPDGALRRAVETAERAERPLSATERAKWLNEIDAGLPAAVGAAELAQREIVKSADPDAATAPAPDDVSDKQVVPALPLFRAASRNAANAIGWYGEAVGMAAQAVRVLFGEPDEQMLGLARRRVEEALTGRERANRAANNALRFKQEGDEHADRSAGTKNKRLAESQALETVRRIEESSGTNEDAQFDAELRREKRERKHLARVLREIVGNAFSAPRFEAAWRTDTVVTLARGIFEERAFDRMPILADALLDADCDEEAILRHCRGTEVGVKEQPQHVRGCWVVELILGRYEPLPAAKPAPKAKKKRSRLDELFDFGPLADDDRLA